MMPRRAERSPCLIANPVCRATQPLAWKLQLRDATSSALLYYISVRSRGSDQSLPQNCSADGMNLLRNCRGKRRQNRLIDLAVRLLCRRRAQLRAHLNSYGRFASNSGPYSLFDPIEELAVRRHVPECLAVFVTNDLS
jgi:hypothetical protein